MANIIDGLEKASRQELAELASLLETYTFSRILYISAHKTANFFRKILHKKYTSLGMQSLLHQTEKELAGLHHTKFQERFRKDLKREIRAAGKFNSIKTDDKLSVCMLKAVSSLYGKKRYSAMSPAETADDLKIKCQKRNPKIITKIPVVWLWCSVILFLCILFVFKYPGDRNYINVFAADLCLEAVWWILCKKRLALEKLAQVITLSGISYGTSFSVQSKELSIRSWLSADADRFERGLRALHTLQNYIRERTAGKNRLCQLNKQSAQLYQSNLHCIEQIRLSPSENTMEQNEQNRKIQEYQADNARLEEEKKLRLETIATAERQIQFYNDFKSRLEEILFDTICGLWENRYSGFHFRPEFFRLLVRDFEWFSFEMVERRLFELEKTNDPKSSGRFRNGCYFFDFPIGKESCALVYNCADTLEILSIQRDFPCSDVGMSDQQLKDTLIEYGLIEKKQPPKYPQTAYNHDAANKLIREMAIRIKQGHKTIGKLSEQVDTLALEKKSIELEKKSLLAEKKELTEKLQHLQRMMRQDNGQNIQELITSEDELKNQISELEKRLSEKTAEIDVLQAKFDSTYKEALLELEKQKNQTQKLRDTIDQNTMEMSRLQDEYHSLQQSNHDLTDQLAFSTSTLKKVKDSIDQQKKENIEQKRTYEKLKASSSSMERTIAEQKQRMRDIEAERKALDKENKGIQKGLEIAQTRISEQKKQIEQLNQTLASRQAQLASARIIENYDIRKEFEKAFADAQTEIDIISPWLAKFTAEPIFYAMIRKALQRGVVIKIRYGFHDNRGGPDISRETLKQIVKSGFGRSRDEWSILNIYKLHKEFDGKYPGKIITCRQDSHAKVLITDKKYYLIGSFNFLSYDGSDAGRGEMALQDSNQSVIAYIYSRYFSFDTNKPEWVTDSGS